MGVPSGNWKDIYFRMKNLLLIAFSALVVFLPCCKSVAWYPMDAPSAELMNDKVIGKWRVEEDTDKNNYFEVARSQRDYMYDVTYWNMGGANPVYKTNLFFSKINNFLFLNVTCWKDERADSIYAQEAGYCFEKILKVDPEFTKMTMVTATDTSLAGLNSSLEVFNRVAKNLNVKSFYGDTVHFYKLK